MAVVKEDSEIYQLRNSAFNLVAEKDLTLKENSTESINNFLQFFEAVYVHWLKIGISPEADWEKVKAKIESRKLWMKMDGCFK